MLNGAHQRMPLAADAELDHPEGSRSARETGASLIRAPPPRISRRASRLEVASPSAAEDLEGGDAAGERVARRGDHRGFALDPGNIQELRKCSGHADSDIDVPNVSSAPAAVGGPAEARIEPGAAAQHAKTRFPACSRILPG